MSKKIFHAAPEKTQSSSRRIMMVDPVERRKEKKSRELEEGVAGRGTERRKARQAVKREARSSRDTTRQQRRQAKLPVSSIDFEIGDLVYHVKNENTFMLVTGIDRSVAGRIYVECMLGTKTIEYRAIKVRKADAD